MFEGFVLKEFLGKWWPALAGGALLVAVLMVAFCQGKQAGKSGEVAKQQQREIKVRDDVGRADGNASAARVDDAVRTEQQKQELHDAIENATDPDDARRRAGCVILRQQGRDPSRIPGCR
ncbi:hypothetical protein [Sphingomonas immobilis]|uniref:Uncharacterized protein n=1 Tax=Sphingomonas immobilis TaxID=3063997 RepID=A0ABT8ZU16_9SPHN|nr:hypothetical protein [Sphingomonas sp. CA1-15]MDO7841062.1 hypothetical protein [Sphingomonas sp. CA1-15]